MSTNKMKELITVAVAAVPQEHISSKDFFGSGNVYKSDKTFKEHKQIICTRKSRKNKKNWE